MKASYLLLALIPLCFILMPSCNSQGMKTDAEARTGAHEQEGRLSPQIANYLVDIFEDSKGHLWFGTISKGVARYDGKSLTYLTKSDGLPDNRVTSIAEDNDGIYWFGTESGLVKYDGTTFTTYNNFTGSMDADYNRVTNVLIDGAGDFWIGTWGGVYHYDGETFSEFELPRPEVDTVWNQDTKDWTSIDMIDSEGNIWFSIDAYGAMKYDGESFTHFTKKEGLLSNSVTTVVEGPQGDLWFGTRVSEKDHPDLEKRFGAGGLSRYDGISFTHFPEYAGLSENDVYSLYTDKSGNVWISTLSDGLYKYDGKQFTNYQPAQEDSTIPFKGIQSMLEDSKGNFWIGCSGGLFRLEGERVINITQAGPWK